MSMVNIPSTIEDVDYHYKMPRLISKLEGHGNSMKTCIVNMGDVARTLNRPPQYATKWFGLELGVKSLYIDKEGEGECAKFSGHHDISAFQYVLDRFIDKYVCCGKCHLPEVVLDISLLGVIRGKCKACGWANELDNKHKVAHFISKHPPDESGLRLKTHAGKKLNQKDSDDLTDSESESDWGGSSYDEGDQKKHKRQKDKKEKKEKKDKKEKKEKKHTKEKKEKKERKSSKESCANDESDEGATESTGKELSDDEPLKATIKEVSINIRPVQKRMSQAASGYDSPEIAEVIKTLQDYVKTTGDSLTIENFFDELRLAQLAEVFDHKTRLYVVLETLLGADMNVESVHAWKGHIGQAVSNASMPTADVLRAFNAYIKAHPRAAKGFPLVLKMIYDEEWATDTGVLEYFGSDDYLDEPGFVQAKQLATPFLRWLSSVESADEDSNDDW